MGMAAGSGQWPKLYCDIALRKCYFSCTLLSQQRSSSLHNKWRQYFVRSIEEGHRLVVKISEEKELHVNRLQARNPRRELRGVRVT